MALTRLVAPGPLVAMQTPTPSGGAGITFGGEGAALFVAREDDADFVSAGEGLMQLLGGATGVGEDDVHVLTDKAGDNSVGTLHFGADFGLRKRSGRGLGFHGVDKG